MKTLQKTKDLAHWRGLWESKLLVCLVGEPGEITLYVGVGVEDQRQDAHYRRDYIPCHDGDNLKNGDRLGRLDRLRRVGKQLGCA